MQAVILAGGKGSRLQEASGGRPKCLLDVGGSSLIDHQIQTLADNGINEILVITGYEAGQVRTAVGPKAEFIENERYAETNSLYSLWLARDWVKGPFILMNSDLLYHPMVLDRLLREKGSALVFDSTSSRGLEQTKVAINRGRVVDLGKDLPGEAARGESLGLLRFDAAGAHALFKRAHYLVTHGGETDWVIEGLRSVCAEVEVRGLNVAGLPWVEIDFPGDLDRARNEVWPAIRRTYWKHVLRKRWILWIAGSLAVGGLVLAGFGINSLLKPPPLTEWETIHPVEGSGQLISVDTAHKARTQRWWLGEKNGPPLRLEVEGPERLQAEFRLLLPPGATKEGRYVVEALFENGLVEWRAFKAVPQPDTAFPGFAVCEKDSFTVDVPPGRHLLQVKMIAGTSDRILIRVRKSQEADRRAHEEDSLR